MLRLPFSSLPLFSFFLPLTRIYSYVRTYIHTYTQTRAHRHVHTHTHIHHTAEFPAFSDTHTHIRFVNYPVASETSTRPRKVCPPPCTGFRGVSHPLENSSTPRHDFSWLCYSLLRTMLLGGRKAKRTELSAVPSILVGYTDFPHPPLFRFFSPRQSMELWNFTTL